MTPYKDAVIVNANNDTLPDLLLFGNFYENNIQMGRYDADFGTLLVNKGAGKFECEPVKDLSVKGQIRSVHKLRAGGTDAFLLAKNNSVQMVHLTGRYNYLHHYYYK